MIAIALATAAFAVWDITGRSPAGLAREIRNAAENGTLFGGIMRFFIGAALFAVSVGAVIDAVPLSALPSYSTLQILAVVTALVVDLLIGDDLRRILRL